MTIQRFIALIIIIFPVVLAGYGIKLMRDCLFQQLLAPYPSLLWQFIAGLAFFFIGMYLIGGFILHRDRKNNKVAPRFQKKK